MIEAFSSWSSLTYIIILGRILTLLAYYKETCLEKCLFLNWSVFSGKIKKNSMNVSSVCLFVRGTHF